MTLSSAIALWLRTFIIIWTLAVAESVAYWRDMIDKKKVEKFAFMKKSFVFHPFKLLYPFSQASGLQS